MDPLSENINLNDETAAFDSTSINADDSVGLESISVASVNVQNLAAVTENVQFQPTSGLFSSGPLQVSLFGDGVTVSGGSTDQVRSLAGVEDECAESRTQAGCIWIPSDKTKDVLLNAKASDKRTFYTMPGISVQDLQDDPLKELVKIHCGNEAELLLKQRRQSAGNISDTAEGLQFLMERCKYRDAANLTAKLLANLGHGLSKAHHKSVPVSEQNLKLWSVRFELLVILGQFSVASQELEPFGDLDAPDLYYEYFPDVYRGKKGSFVPFDMRLLHADLPRLLSRPSESLPRITRIVETIKKMLKNQNLSQATSQERCLIIRTVWRRRLIEAQKVLVNCLYCLKDYQLALNICQKMLHSGDESPYMNSTMGRICMQLGDLPAASVWFKKFDALTKDGDAAMKATSCINHGYSLVFTGSYSEALAAFNCALDVDPAHVSAANNTAICMLYLGRLTDAVTTLESFMRKYPTESLNDQNFCTNLCTLYELASAKSVRKKAALLSSVLSHCGQHFNVNCLKLSMP